MSGPPNPPGPTRAPALRLAAGVLGAEGVAAAAFGVFEATQIDFDRPVVGVGATLILLAYGVLLVLLGRGLLQTRRWARGPVVATQLIQLPIAWSFHEGGTWPVAALLGAASLTVLICVFVPSSTLALVGDDPVPIFRDRDTGPDPETGSETDPRTDGEQTGRGPDRASDTTDVDRTEGKRDGRGRLKRRGR